MKKSSTLFFAVFLLGVLSCTANAHFLGTVEMWSTGVGASKPITVWGGSRDGEDVYAGVYMFEKTNGFREGKTWDNGPMSGFCIELGEPAPEIDSKYGVIPLQKGPFSGPMGTSKAKYMSELWGRYYDSGWANGGSYTSKQNVQAAAFAAAIWEILYENLPVSPLKWNVKVDDTIGAGGFHTTFGDAALANSWLHSLDGTGPRADLRVLTHNESQDYIVAVPEPTTLVLFGFGSVLSLIRTRRRTL